MYTYGYLFYIPVSLVLVLILGGFGLVKKRPFPYYLISILVIVYVNKAIELAIFPIFIEDIPEFDILFNIKLIPTLKRVNITQVLLNVLLTFPIGIGLQFVTNFKFKMRAMVAFFCGMSFEALQLILLILFKPINIYFDVLDLLCNIAGVLFGMLAIGAVNILFRNVQSASGVEGMFDYIKKVCSNCANDRRSLDFDVYNDN